MGLPEHKPKGPLPNSMKKLEGASALPKLSKQANPITKPGVEKPQDQKAGDNDKKPGQLPRNQKQDQNSRTRPAGGAAGGQ